MMGAGFWSQFQLAGWHELAGARCVALYNRTRDKAETLALRAGVPSVYDDPEDLLRSESLDFVDIVTSVETHCWLTCLAAANGVDVICQKPMAPDLQSAEGMVATCREAGVKLLVHENWRWQRPIRRLRGLLDEGHVGRPFRARIEFCSSFPVFENQPFLKVLDRFILTDMGSHILDVARFLFGEAERLYCQTHRVHRDIRGEDVATVVMTMRDGMTVICALSYASLTEGEAFPQTFILVEGERGFLELAADYWIQLTTEVGTLSKRYPPPHYGWADPAYDLVQSSIVPCHANLLAGLTARGRAETSGEDNLNTLRLVFAAYESAQGGRVVMLP
jgi:predicted dehydrogenase